MKEPENELLMDLRKCVDVACTIADDLKGEYISDMNLLPSETVPGYGILNSKLVNIEEIYDKLNDIRKLIQQKFPYEKD